MTTKAKVLLPALLCVGMTCADQITTTTGDVINGTIKGIQGGKVTIATAFAGDLQIPREAIKSAEYTTPAPVYVRTDPKNPEKQLATAQRDATGKTVLVEEGTGDTVALTEASTIWARDAEDPDFPPPKSPWAFSVSLGASGTSGTTQEFNYSAYADAVRTTEATTFKLYGSADKTRSEGATTAERYIGGLDFEYRPSNIATGYVRDEIQHNLFNDYNLRNVAGAGYGIYFWNTKEEGRTSLLRFRIGVAHTYTRHGTRNDVGNRDADSDVALDLGLLFHKDFAFGLGWNTEITYTPPIDHPDEGVIVHESKLSYLMSELGRFDERLSDISLEAGMRNEYQMEPTPGTPHTETTWYVRLKKSW